MSLYDKIVHALGVSAMTVLIASEGGALPLPVWLRIVLLLAMGFAGLSTGNAIGGFSGKAGAAGVVLAFLAFGSMLSGCATTAGKQVSAIALKCGAPVAVGDVITVSKDLDQPDKAQLEADAVSLGVPLVLCILDQLIVPHPTMAREIPTTRSENAAAFRSAHR